uniref:Uncharacterized protein n=1 Tax=Acrobeloides nanus TaxID=290746 RepID=A0A914E6F1_9BILA
MGFTRMEFTLLVWWTSNSVQSGPCPGSTTTSSPLGSGSGASYKLGACCLGPEPEVGTEDRSFRFRDPTSDSGTKQQAPGVGSEQCRRVCGYGVQDNSQPDPLLDYTYAGFCDSTGASGGTYNLGGVGGLGSSTVGNSGEYPGGSSNTQRGIRSTGYYKVFSLLKQQTTYLRSALVL